MRPRQPWPGLRPGLLPSARLPSARLPSAWLPSAWSRIPATVAVALALTVGAAGCGVVPPTTVPTGIPSPTGQRDGGASPSAATPVPATETPTRNGDASPFRLDRSRQQVLQRNLTALGRAGTRQEAGAWSSLVLSAAAGATPGFTRTQQTVYANLGRLGLSRLSLTATGRARSATPAGRIAAEVKVSWRLPADDRTAVQLIWFVIDRDGTWAGSGGGPDQADPDPVPLWWLEPVTVARSVRSTVLAGPGVDGTSWLVRADAAGAAVARQLRGSVAGVAPPGSGWNRRLVLEVPANQADVERVVGAPPGTDGQLAAIAFPDATEAGSAPIRIVVNPAAIRGQSEAGLRLLLTHESTHVATRSPASSAPLWLVEGFADAQAYRVVPQGRPPAQTLLDRQVRAHGAPGGPPEDDRFGAQAGDLELTYAEAWSLCDYLARRGGSNRLNAFYALVSRGGADALDSALRRIYRLDRAGLIAGWRAGLIAHAR